MNDSGLNVTMVTQNNETNSDFDIPDYMLAGVTIACTIIFIIGVGGNSLVIWIVAGNRDMRSATNVFLLSLSVADLLVLVICMPSALLEFYGKDVWYIGPAMCKYTHL